MPAFFLELFSEEIPARMQSRGADELVRLVGEALAALQPGAIRRFSGPRRIALSAHVAESVPAVRSIERGPRIGAPAQALAGFLRKHGASESALREEGGFHVLEKSSAAVPAAELIAGVLPDLLRRFAWPKSMRWGGTSAFTWVRPLRRILCLLDGSLVDFSLGTNDDDGHRLVSGDVTEGHRMMAPSPLHVRDADGWERALEQHFVIASADERRARIAGGIADAAASQHVTIVDDPGLVDEVCGLVEWPVPLMGRIDDAFMDLPPEVTQVSMRVNQRYFATRLPDGKPAPWFAFVANIAAPDGGAAIVAGNERVLRARLSDARHFWDLDRRTRLADRVAALDSVTFHARLGTQGARLKRLVPLAAEFARATGADVALAERAALLCKADLTTGMVGEFPELQGVMGGYYAAHDGEDAAVADAVRDHYAPKGLNDPPPHALVTIAVSLADKLDQLAGFFANGLAPTGSGDPFALRRAALGIIRIIRDNQLRVNIEKLIGTALEILGVEQDADRIKSDVFAFLHERLRIQIKNDGGRQDVLNAAYNAERATQNDLVLFLRHCAALAQIIDRPEGRDLLAAYKRAANILAIEAKKDGHLIGDKVDPALLVTEGEIHLQAATVEVERRVESLEAEDFSEAMEVLASMRIPLDEFFAHTTVNDTDPKLRANRLRLLSRVKTLIDKIGYLEAITA